MKKFFSLFTAAAILFAGTTLDAASDNPSSIKIGVVNFRQCVEKSKIGQQEDGNLEALRKQIESVLSEKEKILNDMEEKLNDPDYVDSITPDAERELKRKYRAISQEAAMQQNQFVQTLQQANGKVMQKLADMVTKFSANIAKRENFDLVLTEESSFYYSPSIDITDKVVVMMDEEFNRETPEQKAAPTLSTRPAGAPVPAATSAPVPKPASTPSSQPRP